MIPIFTVSSAWPVVADRRCGDGDDGREQKTLHCFLPVYLMPRMSHRADKKSAAKLIPRFAAAGLRLCRWRAHGSASSAHQCFIAAFTGSLTLGIAAISTLTRWPPTFSTLRI